MSFCVWLRILSCLVVCDYHHDFPRVRFQTTCALERHSALVVFCRACTHSNISSAGLPVIVLSNLANVRCQLLVCTYALSLSVVTNQAIVLSAYIQHVLDLEQPHPLDVTLRYGSSHILSPSDTFKPPTSVCLSEPNLSLLFFFFFFWTQAAVVYIY